MHPYMLSVGSPVLAASSTRFRERGTGPLWPKRFHRVLTGLSVSVSLAALTTKDHEIQNKFASALGLMSEITWYIRSR